ELGVLDTGEGIAKGDLANVFKPFFTTKAVGEGTGLGLTICQEIARKYRGKLDIESKEGAWTRVTLQLPYGVNA
ncbi:MAG: ATP-binding protein, partial [Bdellovibrionota bacterium]